MSGSKYINTGKCIWCGRSFPDVSFKTKPHILPGSLGGEEIGVDVCDECNHAFGTSSAGRPSPDLVFKEVFAITRFMCSNLDENSYKQLHSIFFKYHHNTRTLSISKAFNTRAITRQFKRGLYEVFLQKYHLFTGDGNNPKFAALRDFARYDRGDLRVFYAFNNIVLTEDRNLPPSLKISDVGIEEMNQNGAFMFWLYGHPFFMEVFPTIFNVRGDQYLKNAANTYLINIWGNERIYELRDIMQIDFLMQRFSHGHK